jgi:adenylate cyclase
MWTRVSDALAIMTRNIIATDGVIGDFHGDAAMGFWGWPLAMEDRAERAAHAALSIRREFLKAEADKSSPLFGFSCGIGLASGPAIAGPLGTPDQHKVTLFGPVVNLAARLESFTRHLSPMPILLDEATSTRLSRPENQAWLRCRRLMRVRPHGMNNPVAVHELMPEPAEPETLNAEQQSQFTTALVQFETGRWSEALSTLQSLPECDCGVRYLLRYLSEHREGPPQEWNGVINLASK